MWTSHLNAFSKSRFCLAICALSLVLYLWSMVTMCPIVDPISIIYGYYVPYRWSYKLSLSYIAVFLPRAFLCACIWFPVSTSATCCSTSKKLGNMYLRWSGWICLALIAQTSLPQLCKQKTALFTAIASWKKHHELSSTNIYNIY